MTAETSDPRDEPLSSDEQAALARLKRDRQPPVGVEARVLAAVGARETATAHRPRWRLPALTALAASLIFALGAWLGSAWTAPRPAAPAGGTKFMLLLYEDATFQPAADPSSRVREYSAWAGTLARAGQLVSGDELDDTGVGLTGTPTSMSVGVDDVRTQPRGYFVIVAKDRETAATIAATCPHLKYGGRIVIRKILT
jgi:hypothetical protein